MINKKPEKHLFFELSKYKLSNEQKISPPFGDKYFVPRLDEQTPFVNRKTDGMLAGIAAIAKKNNDVLVQKIIGEMMELLFTRY